MVFPYLVLSVRKCEVEAQDKLGQTALALAGKQGQAGTVEQLIKAGASIETRDNRGASPLYLAGRCILCLILYQM